MSRKPLFVLLLATGITLAGVARADDEPASSPTPQGSEERTEKRDEPKPETSTGNPGTGSARDADDEAPKQDAKEPSAGSSADQDGTGTEGATDGQPQADQGPKEVSGMSILGNQEAPKALVIVPWKSSEIGEALGISTMLDDSRRPIDKEVFMRELSYYQIRSERKP